MKLTRIAVMRMGLLLLGLAGVQFFMMFVGDFENPLSACVYWTVASFVLIAGSRWAGFLPTLIIFVFATCLGVFQGVFPNYGYIVYFTMGAALYITLVTTNLHRSPLWGVIIAGVLRVAYMVFVFSFLLPRMGIENVFTPQLLVGIYGWPLWVGSLVGGFAALPVLFRIHMFEQSVMTTDDPQALDIVDADEEEDTP